MTYHDYLLAAKKINAKDEKINKLLLVYLIKKDMVWLYANLNATLTTDFLSSYLMLVEKYAAGYPLAYIINYQWFYGRNFFIDERVLIPRMETEELITNVLLLSQNIFKNKKLKVLDLGTGSGAIAISLALAQQQWKLTASDISSAALKVAKINNDKHKVKNIEFVESDLFTNINTKFDIIVSNPPYIDEQDHHFKTSSLKYEPQIALFAPKKGLEFYELIFKQYYKFVGKQFLLAFEFGFDQKEVLYLLVKQYFKDCQYEFKKDSNNKWRMLFIWKEL